MERIPREIYHTLESIVGSEYITEDPVICQAYSRGGYGKDIYDRGHVRPACVILPGCTEEVQAIVKVCNRYKIPYIPVSTFYIGFCAPTKPYTIMVDLKRMDKLWINEKNMYAVVEPYVNYAQLNTEALKLGLYTNAPLCGAQASVLANHLFQGMGQNVWRTGFANKRILAVEWVLPDGELLHLGSASIIKDYFWGEGPGPDLRGLVRGWFGHSGGLGIVTRIAVKLFPIPYKGVPEVWGVTPSTGFSLPSERFRWYNVTCPTLEKAIKFMREVSKAEIAAVCMRIPYVWRYLRKATCREELWGYWLEDKAKLKGQIPSIVRVAIWGFSSEKQVEYEEKVLMDIANEVGVTVKPASPYAAGECLKPAASVRAFLPGGNFMGQKFNFDSLDHAVKVLKSGYKIKRKHIPPFMDDGEEAGWILCFDFGYHVYAELDYYFDAQEDVEEAIKAEEELLKDDLEIKAYPGAQWGHLHEVSGPHMLNYHKLMEKIGKTFDPNHLSNPPRFIGTRKEESTILTEVWRKICQSVIEEEKRRRKNS